MNSNVSRTHRWLAGYARNHERRPWHYGEGDMQLRHESAAHADADGVPPRVAGLGFNGRRVIVYVFVLNGMVVASGLWLMLVVVRSRPMVVIGVIVASVLVHVQRGPDGG